LGAGVEGEEIPIACNALVCLRMCARLVFEMQKLICVIVEDVGAMY